MYYPKYIAIAGSQGLPAAGKKPGESVVREVKECRGRRSSVIVGAAGSPRVPIRVGRVVFAGSCAGQLERRSGG